MIGPSMQHAEIAFDATKASYSDQRLQELKRKLDESGIDRLLSNVTIYVTGSFARFEANEHSDIDLFILHDDTSHENGAKQDDFNLRTIRLKAKLIDIAEEMKFPAFSNDGEFLRIHLVSELLSNLGGREDDSLNHFTARMLLLLESYPVFGKKTYDRAITETVNAYFRDYKHHPDNFKPAFLLNDIVRFWKTLCLNYEHRRNKESDTLSMKSKFQKIKNFKLKYSRMFTCYATIIFLLSQKSNLDVKAVEHMVTLTPFARIHSAVSKMNSEDQWARGVLNTMQLKYCECLEISAKPQNELIAHFSERANKVEAFKKADAFGLQIYEILGALYKDSPANLRYILL
jgi:predicted nucleotidyltransferase